MYMKTYLETRGSWICWSFALTLLDWQREALINLFVKIHSTLGFYPHLCPTTVPKNSDTIYYPSTGGVEVGPVPYWSGLINGRGNYYMLLSIGKV